MKYKRVILSHTEDTVVVLSWSGVEPDLVMKCIGAAVKSWLEHTFEGMKVQEEHNKEDALFTIRSLAKVYRSDEPFHLLNQAVMRNGVYNLEIETLSKDVGVGRWMTEMPLGNDGNASGE